MADDRGSSKNHFALAAEFTHLLAGSEDLAGTVPAMLERLCTAMNAEAAAVFLIEGEPDDPRARLVCWGCSGPMDVTGLAIPVSSGIVGRAVQSGQSQLVADVHADPDFVPPPAEPGAFAVHSILCAPLLVGSRKLGAVELLNCLGGDGCFDEADRELLETLAAACALALANAQLAREMAQQARIQRDIELAASVQRRLLPADGQPEDAIHGLSLPAQTVSGDYYDILALRNGTTAFALADVSGKGLNAALVMVKVATLFRSLMRELPAPGDLLVRIERELIDTLDSGMFVSMIAGVHDPVSGRVRFANAGHLPPLMHAADGSWSRFEAQAPPLGVLGSTVFGAYEETDIALAGGALYLYSDGVTETRLADGNEAGEAGFRAAIERRREQPPSARLHAIARAFGGDEALRDDLTLLVVAEDGPASTETGSTGTTEEVLIEQSVAADVGELKRIRGLIKEAAHAVGASAEWTQDLVLAVDEACQNIIRHGYGENDAGQITILAQREGDSLVVELLDTAPRVDEDECVGRPLFDVKPGGLGTHFMHSLTDSVAYLPAPDGCGNRLVLTKRLAAGEKDEAP